MKKFIISIALVGSFALGCTASNLINSNKCLVQNITLPHALDLTNTHDCTIKNVTFIGVEVIL